MKIFVSWSGDVSHDVADALKAWLPTVLPKLEAQDVFLSSSDISPGEQWMAKLDQVLESHDFGILCLTRANMTAPWILYEAGALSRHFRGSRVAPLLIGLGPGELVGPLSHWNAIGVTKADVRKLVHALNERMGEDGIAVAKLDRLLEALWGELAPELEKAIARCGTGGAWAYDVFLSAPMAAYADDDAYVRARAEVRQVFDALRDGCGFRVYWAAERIEHLSDFDAVGASVDADLRALEQSRHFVLLYTERLPTSALFEAGYACALKRPSHYFVRARRDLPFLMRALPGAARDVQIHDPDDWSSFGDLAAKVCRHRGAWFPR